MFINFFSKKKEDVEVDKMEMLAFYKMLLKMKKKRPFMDVDRLMKLIYGEKYQDDLDFF